LILSGEGEEFVPEGGLAAEDTREEEAEGERPESNREETLMALSLTSIVGITGNRTLKQRGDLRGEEVIILIDGRATHNFLAVGVIERLGIN